ncbi:MAG: hypothetical protein M3P14_04490 [Chloroflexota bacterium]|nr:hypothetical protein [Chloroflexota bacterium]
MSLARPRSRNLGAGLIGLVDDFMNWLLYGYETWLVALLKGVPLFLYVYFLLTYVPNYIYYGVTQYIPFLKFSPEVGFVIAQGVGGTNFIVLIVLALWTQAARGRRGFAWSLIRILDFLQMLFVYLLLIPLLAFNMAGGTFVPLQGQNPFPLQSIAFGTLVAGLGAAALVYLYFEFRRVSRREAQQAAARSAAFEAG